MKGKTIKLLLSGLLLGAVLFGVGFLLFVYSIQRKPPDSVMRADGIVALTGGSHRIAEALRLLALGKAERLLITGVNKRTSRTALSKLAPQRKALFHCCIDIGYEAQNTIGNANETLAWVKDKNFAKLIVVTSSYHMPRSLAELKRKLPGVELFPFPVPPRDLHLETWWSHTGTARILLSEYVKFIPAAARFALARITGSDIGRDLAFANRNFVPKP